MALRITVFEHRYGAYETGGPNPRRAALFRELARVASEIPGAGSAAVASQLPLKHGPNPWAISIEGRGAPPEGIRDGTVSGNRPGFFNHASVSIERVTPDYFRTLGIPLMQGRYLDERDNAAAPLVTLVNETFVRKFFPDENPIGRRITVDMTSYFPSMTIVGVVADNRMHGLDRELYPLLFWSMDQYPSNGGWLVLHSRGEPSGVARAAQEMVRQIDADLASNPRGGDDARSRFRIALAPAALDRPDRIVRCFGAGARRSRYLRCDRLFRLAAHAGDRAKQLLRNKCGIRAGRDDIGGRDQVNDDHSRPPFL